VIAHPAIAPHAAVRHARVSVHSIWHIGAPHATPAPAHESMPLHSTRQDSVAGQRTPLLHDPSPLHRTVHRGASQVTSSVQLPAPSQRTSHGTPSGHGGQVGPLHVITQVPAAQDPGHPAASHAPASATVPSVLTASSTGPSPFLPSEVARPSNPHPTTTASTHPTTPASA
jgi:hypothetical protein